MRARPAWSAAIAATTAFVVQGVLAPCAKAQRDSLPLWSAGAPGAAGRTAEDVPSITPVLVPVATNESTRPRAAMLVFPGGGYDHLAFEKEGLQVAHWLNTLGINAFVVKYRLGPRYRHPAMEQDGLRAVRLVRASAASYGVDTARVGVMGFSAGGHLAGTVGTHFTLGEPRATDVIERASSRPDAMLLVYPVITMQGAAAHAGSRRSLVGDQPQAAVLERLSLETQVIVGTPPTMIVATTDDKSVPVANAVRFYEALRAAAVPTELHVYESGRHGFGLAPTDSLLATWTSQAALWLQRRGFVDLRGLPADVAAPRMNGSTSSRRAPADAVADGVVDAAYTGADAALVNGIPTYRTLNAALNDAPGASQQPWTIRLRAGRYREKVSVDKPNIRLIGAHRDSTVITWADAAGFPERGGGTIGTRGSWTLRATVADFHATHLTIENAFDFNANARKANTDSTKLQGTQGVALALTERSDRTVLSDVALLGHQDTFFANAGRAYVVNSRIAGNVDFIFGNGRVVFDSSEIVSLDRGVADNNGYIAAPSTDVSTYGFLFLRSRLLKQSAKMAANSVALGRPWHPSADPRAVGQAVFVECWMDDHISTAGWDRMSSTVTVGGERIWFEPSAARFYEYRSTGPGAKPGPTRRQLSEGDVRSYTPALFLNGWIPDRAP